MTNIIKITSLMIISLAVLTACQDNQEITAPLAIEQAELVDYSIPDVKGALPSEDTIYPIWAGRNVLAGNLYLANDTQNLYVTYYLDEGWQLLESNLHVASNVSNIPLDPQGAPLPGQFAYQISLERGTKVYTQVVPIAEIGARLGENVFVASRARLIHEISKSQSYTEEIAWAGDKMGPGPQWWQFLQYRLHRDLSGVDAVGRIKDVVPKSETAMQ